jgi:hypothetical protein
MEERKRMNRMRLTCACAVAAFALTAMFAASASAEPVFLTKTVVAEGVKIPFTATLGAAFLEGSVSKSKIECSGGTGHGEVTGPKTTKNNVTIFTGCKSGTFTCQSGATEGTIETFVLKGALNGITSSLPGVRLFNEATGRGGELAAFNCAGGSIGVKVKGSVIGSLSPAAGTGPETGKLATTGKLTLAEAGGIQKYTSFSEGPEAGQKEQLEAKVGEGGFEKSGQSVIASLKTVPATWGVGVTK